MQKKISTLWAVALFGFIALLLPLYIPERGYSFIGTDKFYFFLYGMVLFVVTSVFLILYAVWKKQRPSFSKIDWFVLLYALCTILSYLFSACKEVALIGNEEWNMGLISQLLFVFIYLGISRYINYIKGCIYTACIVGLPIGILAIVNRFGYYPLPIKGQHPLYISTIGNINWFCGYFIMIVAMELALYFYAKSHKEKLLWGILLFFSLLALICQGSMSGYAALLVMLLLLLKPALASKSAFMTYLEIYLLLFSGCTFSYITEYFIPGAYTEYDPVVSLVAFSVLPCVCLFVTAILYIVFHFSLQTLHLSFLYKYVVGAVIALFAGYLLLCTVNTLFPNVTPFLNDNSFFTFNRYYWSTRGGTYAIGVEAYLSLPWYRKLFGIGSDCFLTYVYSNLDKVTTAQYFQIQPLANAHNEFLTALVNTGLLGCITYAGIFVCSIKNVIKNTNPFIKVLLFGILGYIINNFFSFQQVISTSFVFALLGLLENLLRRERENATN